MLMNLSVLHQELALRVNQSILHAAAASIGTADAQADTGRDTGRSVDRGVVVSRRHASALDAAERVTGSVRWAKRGL
jgi:hypothetical protein